MTMFTAKKEIETKAKKIGIEIKGLNDIPIIVQGRPLFDFVGIENDTLKKLGQNEDDLFQANGLMNIAVFPDGRVEGLKTVSSQYKVVQHGEAILSVLNSLPDNFGLDKIEIGVTPDGGRSFAKFTSDKFIEVKKGDKVKYQAILENSCDTTKKFFLSGGAFRMICSNGMVIPDERVEHSISRKLHKGGLDLNNEIEQFLRIMEQSIQSLDVWKQYSQKTIDAPKLETFFDYLEIGPRTSSEILETELRGENNSVAGLLEQRKLTAWDLYNSFTQRITDSDSIESTKIKNGSKIASQFDAFFKFAS